MTEPISDLREYSSATVHEALGGLGALPPAIKPLDPDTRLCSPAFPVDCRPGDNLALHLALAAAPAGSVIVAAAQGDTEHGHWGEVMTVAAQAWGIAGLVIDGSVRDGQEIRALRFPVFARGLCIRGTHKDYRPTIPAPVAIGGITIRTGDLVVGDGDGVTIVPGEKIQEAATLARDRSSKETQLLSLLRQG